MSIKIRITESQTSHNQDVLTFQFIEFQYQNSLSVNVIGYLEFYKYLDKYFEPTAIVESKKPSDFKKMASIMRKIYTLNYDEQTPSAIIDLLKADVHVIFCNEFVSLKDEGKFLYDLRTYNGELYCRFIAKNDKEATKMANRFLPNDDEWSFYSTKIQLAKNDFKKMTLKK
jgi:hypothetical protein